jgi:hypothetical protein
MLLLLRLSILLLSPLKNVAESRAVSSIHVIGEDFLCCEKRRRSAVRVGWKSVCPFWMLFV